MSEEVFRRFEAASWLLPVRQRKIFHIMKSRSRTVTISFATIGSTAPRMLFQYLCTEPSNDRHGLHFGHSPNSTLRVKLLRKECVAYQCGKAVRTTHTANAVIRLTRIKSADIVICCTDTMGSKLYSLKKGLDGKATLFLSNRSKPLSQKALRQVGDTLIAQAYAMTKN